VLREKGRGKQRERKKERKRERKRENEAQGKEGTKKIEEKKACKEGGALPRHSARIF